METNISVNVPKNSLHEIIEQLKERDDIIFQKISEIDSLREKFFSFLFLGLIVIFFLLFLNIYFIYRWRKAYAILKKNKNKSFKSLNHKKKAKKIFSQNPIFAKNFKNKYPYCQIKNCFFYHRKNQCLLLGLKKEIDDFSKKLFSDKKNEILTKQILKFSNLLNQKCFFNRNIPEKELLFILKKRLEKLRYNLNKIKKERKIDSSLKNEAKSLWQKSHQITLIIIKRQNYL